MGLKALPLAVNQWDSMTEQLAASTPLAKSGDLVFEAVETAKTVKKWLQKHIQKMVYN